MITNAAVVSATIDTNRRTCIALTSTLENIDPHDGTQTTELLHCAQNVIDALQTFLSSGQISCVGLWEMEITMRLKD